MSQPFLTRADLCADLRRLGLGAGDVVMVHAAMGKVGRLLNGPDALIGALRDVVGVEGAILAYADWDARYDALLDADGRVPEAWRPHIPPFDIARSRANRDNGVFPEFLRTTPGAVRSANPGGSVVALGARAEALTRDHPLDYGYGEGSPLARLAAHPRGRVLMVGAPWDTMTILHLAEHRARIPGKRIRRYEVPFAGPGGAAAGDGTVWRMVEEFETSDAIVAGLTDDYFGEVVGAFVAGGGGSAGRIGGAESLLVSAEAVTAFAVAWLESRFPGG